MVIKVKPVEDDISIVSFGNEGVKLEIGNENRRPAGLSMEEKVESRGPVRHSNCCSKFVATWSSTLPDAVGITGTQHVVNSQDNLFRRFVWILALFGGLAAMCYQTIDRAIYFASDPKSVDFEVQYSSELTFPAVTICNYNNFRNIDSYLNNHAFGLLLAEYNNYWSENALNFSAYEPSLAGVNTTELYLELAHQMESSQMFVVGFWDGTRAVTPANFTRVITDFGVCHTFNAGLNGEELLKQSVAGKGHGLSIILDAQQFYYFYAAKRIQASAGFMVAVHDQTDVPEVDSQGVGVSPGTEARIGIQKKKATNLPPPHGVCATKELKYFSSYTINTCRQECLIDYILETCGCVEPYMAVSSEMTVCNPVEVFSCVFTEKEKFSSDTQCSCPVPCELTTYSTSMSYAYFPSDFYIQRLLEIYASMGTYLSADYFTTNVLKIEVYFEAISVENLIQQEAYTFFAFLCDFGGSLGLWLGGSVLTFVEILDHFGYTVCTGGAASQHAT